MFFKIVIKAYWPWPLILTLTVTVTYSKSSPEPAILSLLFIHLFIFLLRLFSPLFWQGEKDRMYWRVLQTDSQPQAFTVIMWSEVDPPDSLSLAWDPEPLLTARSLPWENAMECASGTHTCGHLGSALEEGSPHSKYILCIPILLLYEYKLLFLGGCKVLEEFSS